MGMDAAAQRKLQAVLQKAQAAGFKAMGRLADSCMAEGRYGLAGSIYEGLGHDRKAANAYLKGGNLNALKDMIDGGKLIMKGTWAERAFKLAARQGEWRTAEELARIIVQRRVFGLGWWTETSAEAEIMVACARDQYYGQPQRVINMEFTCAQQAPDGKEKE